MLKMQTLLKLITERIPLQSTIQGRETKLLMRGERPCQLDLQTRHGSLSSCTKCTSDLHFKRTRCLIQKFLSCF